MRSLLAYGIQAHVGTVALFLAYRVDILLVNYFLGPAAAGVYSVALTLSEVLRAIPEAGQMAIYARTAADGQLPVIGSMTRVILIGTCASSLLIAGLNYWLVPLVFGAASRQRRWPSSRLFRDLRGSRSPIRSLRCWSSGDASGRRALRPSRA